MAVKWFLLFFFAICTAESNGKTSTPREPDCGKSGVVCRLHLRPMCGTDGITYYGECDLCDKRLKTKENILIAKYGPC